MAHGAASGAYWRNRLREAPRSSLTRPDVREVPVFIYGLAGVDGVVRYVGKSHQPRRRLSSHRHPTAVGAVREWLLELDARGEDVRILILREVPPGEDAAPAERAVIAALEPSGRLLNVQGTRRRGRCRYCQSQTHNGRSCPKGAA